MTQLNIPNLDKLIVRLEAIEPIHFNMRHVCGTACCITGWSIMFFKESVGTFINLPDVDEKYRDLIMPDYENEGWLWHPERYPLSRALEMLQRLRDRFLATGEIVVDWGPEPTEGQPWSAPQAVEQPPALPAEITRLLAPVAVTEEADHG